jgi:phage baseplate assembly protein gpV
MTMTSGAADVTHPILQSFAPKILVDGTAMSGAEVTSLNSMDIEKTAGMPDLCELRFIQSSDSMGTPNDDITTGWKPGAELKVETKVGNEWVVAFVGEITSVDFVKEEGAPSQVVLLAYDKRHRLYRNEVVKVFKDQSFKDIVASLASEVSVTHDLSGLPTTVLTQYLHEGTVGDLVDRLCAQFGLYAIGDDGKLLVKKGSELTTSGGTLRAAVEMREFRLRQTTSSDHAEVTVRGWDPKNQEAIVTTKVRSAALPAGGVLAGPDSGAAFSAGKVLHTTHVAARAEADDHALGILTGNVDAGMQLDATTQYLPKLTPGKVVTIEGVPQRFAGKYRLTAVRHRYDLDEGTRSYVTCRGADDTSLTGLLTQAVGGRADASPQTVSHGLRPAIVKNLRSASQEGALAENTQAAEVKVEMPWLGDQIESGWLRVVTIGGGADRGFFVMPEVGDEVLVSFHDGDIRTGYVIGGLYNGTNKPPRVAEAINDSNVHERIWKSRSGHEIAFGDESGKEFVQIKTKADEMVVRLDVPNKVLKITGEDVTIENTGKITIKSTGEVSIKSDGDLKMEAMNINLKAQQNVKVEGLQVSVNGQTGAEVKGAKVDINAQGPATVKGNPIMLN